MPLFRADFELSSELVLPNDAAPLKLVGDGCEITFVNAQPDKDGFAPGLIARVVASAESFDAAVYSLREILARHLDVATFSTHSRFKINQALRLIEWEPKQRTRRAKVFQKFDPLYPPDPELTPAHKETIEAIAKAGAPGYVVAALRSFRNGLLAPQAEDQFQRFWLAVEIIAEGAKENEIVPVPCWECGVALVCVACGKALTRRPMARQAIFDLVSRVYRGDAKKLYRRASGVRDGLMHGRSRASIEHDTGIKFGDLVDEIAGLAWHVIYSCIPLRDRQQPLALAHRDGAFAARELVMGVVGEFDWEGEADYPPDDKIFNIEISQITQFQSSRSEAEGKG